MIKTNPSVIHAPSGELNQRQLIDHILLKADQSKPKSGKTGEGQLVVIDSNVNISKRIQGALDAL